MQSVTTYKVLNNLPYINITYKGLLAIKEIVKIAPQEAQWFHTVEPFTYKQSPHEIQLLLSDKIYIPSQNTSAVQVDTTSAMMMDFYKELQEDYQDQDVVNQKLAAMTCWCHSHHNMSPNPSHQDDLQFNSFISLAEDQGQKSWQIMLIFNKKDQFYSRVYDPYTSTIHEGVPVNVINDYNFNYIHQAAKHKFKKPKLTSQRNLWSFNQDRLHAKSPAPKTATPLSSKTTGPESVNWEIAVEIMSEAFDWYSFENLSMSQYDKKVDFTELRTNDFFVTLANYLDDKEIILFSYLVSKQAHNILPVFTEKAFEKKFSLAHYDDFEAAIIEEYTSCMKNKDFTLSEISEALQDTLKLTEISTKKDCKEFLKENGHI